MEKTFIMVKPDGVQRDLVGKIITRFEERGLQMVALKMLQVPRSLAQQHYGEHREKPFFGELVSFITSGPVVAMVWQGEGAIALARKMMGKTDPAQAEPGTIRGDYAIFTGNNVIHGSDSPESARKEIGLFFRPEELVDYQEALHPWVYGP